MNLTLALSEILHWGLAIVAVSASHFLLKQRIAVLEERLKGYSEAVKRIFETLKRIEEKLDKKVDKE